MTNWYEPCANCGHSRQWHMFGPRCRKTSDCPCREFKPAEKGTQPDAKA